MKKNNRITGLFRKVIVILLAVVLAAGVPSPTDVQAASQKSKVPVPIVPLCQSQRSHGVLIPD